MKNMFCKIKNWWEKHGPSKRRLIQLYSALLFNCYLKGYTPESTTGTASHPLPTGNPPRAALFRPAPATLPVPYQFLAFTPG